MPPIRPSILSLGTALISNVLESNSPVTFVAFHAAKEPRSFTELTVRTTSLFSNAGMMALKVVPSMNFE